MNALGRFGFDSSLAIGQAVRLINFVGQRARNTPCGIMATYIHILRVTQWAVRMIFWLRADNGVNWTAN